MGRRTKMKKQNYLTGIVLVTLIFSLLLSACGSAPAPTQPPAEPTQEEQAAAPTEAPAEPTEEESMEVSIETSATEVAEDVAEEVTTAYSEAPMLAEMVAAGDIPPVDERLPSNPRVLPVYEEIGQYGGTLRRAYKGVTDRWGPTKLQEERIVEFYPDADGNITLVPNWVDEFSINDTNTEFTFHIREGLRWSDGVPVTTEDVRFWYEDIYLTTYFQETPHQNLTSGGNPLEIEIVDDLTFVVKFTDPYPLFPIIMAKESTGSPGLTRDTFLLPSHYLQDFHPNYKSEDELAALAAEYGVEGWSDLWGSKGPIQSWWLNPDLPVISAWKIETPPPGERVVMVRNPYYWQVDAEGNQLPYIDYITHDLFESLETLNLWIVQGQIDFQARHIDGLGNYTLFKENEDAGNYHLNVWLGGGVDALYPNLNTPDPVLAELFNDPRFRQALSVAINRSEINEIVYSGLGEPRQASPISGSTNFDAEFEKKWAEYDPDTANALLDELGLTERDGSGFRLRPDGETLQVIITTRNDDTTKLELVKAYWEEVGIKTVINLVERSLYTEQANSGEVEIGEWGFDRQSVIAADPRRYTAALTDGPWAPLYGLWFDSAGASGVEPPADHAIRDVWEAWENAQTAATLDEANQYVQDMVTIHKENVWVIGLVGETPSIFIASNDLGNVPTGFINDDALRSPGNAQPAQFFFRSQ
jgi:peptide/nickel transport system substrate-binding protein